MHGFARRRPKKTARRARPTADHAALGGSPAEVLSAVLAEGIEEPEELHWLQRVGIDLVQGFYFARPAHPPPALASAAP